MVDTSCLPIGRVNALNLLLVRLTGTRDRNIHRTSFVTLLLRCHYFRFVSFRSERLFLAFHLLYMFAVSLRWVVSIVGLRLISGQVTVSQSEFDSHTALVLFRIFCFP